MNNLDQYPEWLDKSVSTEYLDSMLRYIVKVSPEWVFNFIEMPNGDDGDVINSIKRKKGYFESKVESFKIEGLSED